MAIMKKTVAPKTVRPAPVVETRESTEAQVAVLLQAGGEIRKVAKGVSDQVYSPSRQITISKKR